MKKVVEMMNEENKELETVEEIEIVAEEDPISFEEDCEGFNSEEEE